MPLNLKLYTVELGAPSRAVLMVLEALGIECEKQEISLMAGEHLSPEFVKINPISTLPALQDGDFNVSDSHAIAVYLVCKYGAEKREALYPNDIRLRATVEERLHFDTGTIFPNLRTIILSAFMAKAQNLTEDQIYSIELAYGKLEKYLKLTKYIALDHITVADICAVSSISTLNEIHKIQAEKFPRVAEWLKALEGETWFQRGNAKVQEFGTFVKSIWSNNKNVSQ